MKKMLIVGFLLVVVIFPAVTLAQTASLTNAQIDAIVGLLQSFGADPSTVTDVRLVLQGNAPPTVPVPWCHTFNTNLRVGDSGTDVTALRTALSNNGFPNPYRSSFFDERLASLVSGFQEKYKQEVLAQYGLQRGTGYVGPTTRAKLNNLYGCGSQRGPIAPPVTPPPIITPLPIPVPSGPPAITVLSPNGGESYQLGGFIDAKWSHRGLTSNRQVDGYLVPESNPDRICYIGSAPVNSTTSFGISSDRLCSDNTRLTAGEYKLRLLVYQDVKTLLTRDSSNAPFTITAPRPTAKLSADKTSIVSDGKPGTVVLTWTSRNTTSCHIGKTLVGTSGSKRELVSATTTYVLSCQGPGGKVLSDPVTVMYKLTPLDDPLPDLMIHGFQVAPSVPISGQPASLTISVINLGNLAADTVRIGTGSTFSVFHIRSDSTCDLPLLPGATCKNVYTFTAPESGSHRFNVSVDIGNLVRESNENNNHGTFTVNVSPAPSSGTLILSIDSRIPERDSFSKGSVNVPIARFKFTAPAQSQVTISNITFTNQVDTGSGLIPKTSSDLRNFSLWDDAGVKIGQTVARTVVLPPGITPGRVEFNSIDWVVPAGRSKTLTVRADVSSTAEPNRHAIHLSGFSHPERVKTNWGDPIALIAPSFTIISESVVKTAKINISADHGVSSTNPDTVSPNFIYINVGTRNATVGKEIMRYFGKIDVSSLAGKKIKKAVLKIDRVSSTLDDSSTYAFHQLPRVLNENNATWNNLPALDPNGYKVDGKYGQYGIIEFDISLVVLGLLSETTGNTGFFVVKKVNEVSPSASAYGQFASTDYPDAGGETRPYIEVTYTD
jgi:hypothetical protein